MLSWNCWIRRIRSWLGDWVMDWLSKGKAFSDSSRLVSARVCLFGSVPLDTGDWPALRWLATLSWTRCKESDHSGNPQHLLYLLWIHFQQRPGASQLEETSVVTGEQFSTFLFWITRHKKRYMWKKHWFDSNNFNSNLIFLFKKSTSICICNS